MTRKRGGAVSAKLTKDFIKASYEATPRQQIDGFIYDPSVSATTARVYHNPTTGQTILTNRGTEGTMSDWGNNLAYTLGRHKNTKRFKEAEKVQKLAEAKYGASNISQISHSQGAIYGRELGKNVKEHISLNPAYKGEKENENEYVVKSELDPVSNAYGALVNAVTPNWMKWFQKKKPTKETVIEAKTLNPVEEHLAGVLDRLDPEHQLGKVGSGRRKKKGGKVYQLKDAKNIRVRDYAPPPPKPLEGVIWGSGLKRTRKIKGGANIEQKGRASEMRSYLPPEEKQVCNLIVHSGDAFGSKYYAPIDNPYFDYSNTYDRRVEDTLHKYMGNYKRGFSQNAEWKKLVEKDGIGIEKAKAEMIRKSFDYFYNKSNALGDELKREKNLLKKKEILNDFDKLKDEAEKDYFISMSAEDAEKPLFDAIKRSKDYCEKSIYNSIQIEKYNNKSKDMFDEIKFQVKKRGDITRANQILYEYYDLIQEAKSDNRYDNALKQRTITGLEKSISEARKIINEGIERQNKYR